MSKDLQKPKRYRLYEFFNGGNGDGVRANPNAPRDLKYFFGLYKRRFGMLITVNFMMVVGNFPVLFAFFAMTGYLDTITTGAVSGAFSQLYGSMTAGATITPAFAALFGVHGVQGTVSIPTFWTYLFYGIAFVGTLFTFGLVNTGTAHIFRSIVRESPVFIWSDFWDTVKKNWKQGILLGALDLIFCIILGYNFFFYLLNGGQLWSNVMFYFNLFIIFCYFIMRFYLYLMMITFDLSIRKLFKNALLFVVIGLKRNVLGVIGVALVIALNWFLLMLYYPLGLMMPFLLTFSNCTFICAYAAYPKIKEIMIDPYMPKPARATDEDEEDDADDEADDADDEVDDEADEAEPTAEESKEEEK